jgi:DNA-binding beta-propeller fold protein YncE
VHDSGSGSDLVVSPDGRNVYAVDSANDHLLVFDREQATGRLRQKTGQAGCVQNGPPTTYCGSARLLDGPSSLAISPGGRTLYVASTGANAILVFDRNTTTGVIVQKAGDAGCIADSTPDCRAARRLVEPLGIALSPDGRNLYAAVHGSDAVTALTVAADGSLTQTTDGPGGAGCVTSLVDCVDGPALDGPEDVAVTRDAVFVGTSDPGSVVALRRDPATGPDEAAGLLRLRRRRRRERLRDHTGARSGGIGRGRRRGQPRVRLDGAEPAGARPGCERRAV